MAIIIEPSLLQILQDERTVKVLSAVGRDGIPHTAFLQLLDVTAEGQLVVLTQLETSRLTQRLLYSLWFSHPVTLALRSADGASYTIQADPYRCIVTGKLFEKYYQFVRQQDVAADLAAVWLLTPTELQEETYSVLRQREQEEHPMFLHLDRIRKE